MTIDPLLSNEPFEKHIQGISCVHLKTLEAPRYPHRQNAKRKWGRVLKGISAYSCLYRASRCSHFPLEGNLGTNKHYKSSIKDWDKFLWPLRRWQDSHLLLINQELHFPCDKHSWRSPWKAERLLWCIFSSENTVLKYSCWAASSRLFDTKWCFNFCWVTVGRKLEAVNLIRQAEGTDQVVNLPDWCLFALSDRKLAVTWSELSGWQTADQREFTNHRGCGTCCCYFGHVVSRVGSSLWWLHVDTKSPSKTFQFIQTLFCCLCVTLLLC